MLRRVVAEKGRLKQSSQEEVMGVLRRKGRVLLRRVGKVCPKIDVESSNEHGLSSSREAWWMHLFRGEMIAAVHAARIG
jgi:hypothetical protein